MMWRRAPSRHGGNLRRYRDTDALQVGQVGPPTARGTASGPPSPANWQKPRPQGAVGVGAPTPGREEGEGGGEAVRCREEWRGGGTGRGGGGAGTTPGRMAEMWVRGKGGGGQGTEKNGAASSVSTLAARRRAAAGRRGPSPQHRPRRVSVAGSVGQRAGHSPARRRRRTLYRNRTATARRAAEDVAGVRAGQTGRHGRAGRHTVPRRQQAREYHQSSLTISHFTC